ncbi:MAG: YceI family protein [Dehalococcoidia bacterium]|nr:YceI family protein [Dehalococcoidia bacterium]
MSLVMRWPFRIAGAAVLLVILAAAGWWFFIRSDNELATTARDIPEEVKSGSATPGAAGTSTAPTVAGGTRKYAIIAGESEAAYFADEKLANLPLPSTAKGTTKAIEGHFYLGADGLDTAQESKFTVDLTTLRSDQSRRDNQVQQRGLETAKYPKATFVAKKLEGYPKEFPAGQEVEMKLTGKLDLHGVTKEVTWDVKMKKEGDAISALATVNFKYADFNIPVLNIAGMVSVEDDVTLQVQVVAKAGG